MSDGVIVLDEKGLIVDYNKAVLNIIPAINASSIGKNIDGLLANNKILADFFSKREECDYEYSRDFPHSHVQIRFTPIVTGHNNVLGTIVTFADITESIRMQEKLRQLASYDGLTQIYNRTFFMQQAEEVLTSKKQMENFSCSLVLFDIDYFKTVNDTYGHETGDIVLAHVATLAQKNLDEQDIFGRYGGEEFIILLPGADIEDAFEKASAIKVKISEHASDANGKECDIQFWHCISRCRKRTSRSAETCHPECGSSSLSCKKEWQK